MEFDVKAILIAIGVIAIIALVIGIILAIAEKVFHVEINENEAKIREALPGSNCGGCGYAGCDAMATAIANGEAAVNGCPVGGTAVAKKIADIMGKEAIEVERMVAFVKCDGTSDKKNIDYNYMGVQSCVGAALMPGSGPYSCKDGCLGFGSCAKACPQGAIRIINKKAVVDKELCIACGQCIKTCPHKLIELVPAGTKYIVQCSSHVKGKNVMNACTAGCISCGICEKNCPSDAIHVVDNIAKIDYSKCTQCGICYSKCPRKIIKEY